MIGIGLALQGCVGTRYLQKNEYLLVSQRLKGNKKIKQEALVPAYQQTTNRQLLGLPIWLWLYELGRTNFDAQKLENKLQKTEASYAEKLAQAANNPRKLERLKQRKNKKLATQQKVLNQGNWLMRIGEPPVIYNPQQQNLTENNLLHYLHAKGYFQAKVSSKVKLQHKKAYIKYAIQENTPYLIQTLKLQSPDTAIYQALQPYQEQSLIQPGSNYDQATLGQERERIYNLLINKGYWDFSKQYISFYVDTTGQNHTVDIATVIALPEAAQGHIVYHIDSVVVALEPQYKLDSVKTLNYEQLTFKNWHNNFNPRILASKISLKPSQLYNKTAIIDIQKNLDRLDTFKYIHITHDTLSKGHLITYIHTSLANRFQLTNELGIQMSKVSPKPFYELSLKIKNWFKRLELVTLSTQISVAELVTASNEKRIYNTQTFNIDFGLNVPQFLLPIPSKTQTWLDFYKPFTKLNIGYAFSKRPDYTKKMIQTLLSYNWQGNQHIFFELIPLNIDLIDSKVSASFDKALQDRKARGDNLYRIYQPSLVSNASLRIILQNQVRPDQVIAYTYLELLLESGGTLQNFLDFQKLISKRLTYYKYLRFNIAYIQHIPLYTGTKLAYQVNMGIAYPYDQYKILPHDKYYFAGGPNSIRAWYPRTLGPGSYHARVAKHTKQLQEQPGELLLQGNVEIRQQLIGYLEGALFVDMGNIWMLRESIGLGENFCLDRFYQEIAMGTGVGLRLNFKFFVVRFDVGLKLYDPAKPLGSRLFSSNICKDFTLNIGLGYPF